MEQTQPQKQANIRQEVKDLEQQIIDIRRHIHQYPETCYEEVKTAEFIVQQLKKNTQNLTIIENVGKTGVVAILEGKLQNTPCILLRADMDALNLTEKSGDEFASKIPGKHHACGHDGHVAMLLAAAIYADKQIDNMKGTIKFCFQPAEEGGAGANAMIEDKVYPVLENPYVDKCYGIHMNNSQYVPHAAIAEGAATANSDQISIKIIGKGGHAMCPDQSVDAMMIGCNLVTALYQITSRNIAPENRATITFGKIESGTSHNIVASECKILGSVRTLLEDDRQTIYQRFKHIIEGFEISYQCKIELDYKMNYNAVVNDLDLCQEIYKSVGKITPVHKQTAGMAGEDFSFFSAKRPCAFFLIGSAPEGSVLNNGKTILKGHHSPKFSMDERGLLVGASAWVQLIDDLLIN